ncbi:unnamed protein product, partial [Pylaiella littoralis]
ARYRCRRSRCPAVDPNDGGGEAKSAGVNAENDRDGSGVVVGAVEIEAPNGLHVGLAGPLDAHHPLLVKRDDRGWRLASE